MNGPRVIGAPGASLAGPAGDGKDVAPGHCVIRLRQVGVMHTSPRMRSSVPLRHVEEPRRVEGDDGSKTNRLKIFRPLNVSGCPIQPQTASV